MCKFKNLPAILAVIMLHFIILSPMLAQNISNTYPNIGRLATANEVKAWDIDVRPDFKGLPPGSGSVSQGQNIWEAKCESCHGTFGEANHTFNPIVGGTDDNDSKNGLVANLQLGKGYPQRTTFMKLSQISTLWDYIYRAMPWTEPKSLQPYEVYAVVAYILNLANIVPDDFELHNQNIASINQKLPNRNGMVSFAPLWQANSRISDTKNTACMKNCIKDSIKDKSLLPDFARQAHGVIKNQVRPYGPFGAIE